MMQAAAQAVFQRMAAEGVSFTRGELEAHGRDLLQKADAAQYGANPWSQCAGLSLDELLARTGEEKNALRVSPK